MRNIMISYIKFSADWCGPCKILTETLSKLTTPPIESINIDEDNGLVEKYKVRGIPTIIKLEDGVEIDRLVGTVTLVDLANFLEV